MIQDRHLHDTVFAVPVGVHTGVQGPSYKEQKINKGGEGSIYPNHVELNLKDRHFVGTRVMALSQVTAYLESSLYSIPYIYCSVLLTIIKVASFEMHTISSSTISTP